MPTITVDYRDEVRTAEVPQGDLLAHAVTLTGFPLEQPCAGRGTCGKCKVIVEGDLASPDEIERAYLTQAELESGYRLACRARLSGDAQVHLATIVVYSDKIFTHSTAYRRNDDPLGLAVDLGSTTVAAFLTSLSTGEVYAGAATLNQQTMFGADVISRLDVGLRGSAEAERLSALAVASIKQAVDALHVGRRVRARVRRAVIVGNTAMHHLLLRLPLESLALMPFQPYRTEPIRDADSFLSEAFPPDTEINLPPLIGGFVGSDALACLAYFGFDKAPGPMAAIDLGTNGEIMVTDGENILVASTAAGPAFEGVNISCGTRAVAGAVVEAHVNGDVRLITIGGEAPIGIAGSGLLSLVHELRRVGLIARNGRILPEHPTLQARIEENGHERRLRLTETVYLSQNDVRELQKAKGAIRAATDILMNRLGLKPGDLQRVFLTGSFGGKIDLEALLNLGMIPPVRREVIQSIPNGAGMGAALFLNDAEFERGVQLATKTEHIELDVEPDFIERYVEAMAL